MGYLHHLANIFGGDEKEDISRRRNDGFLVGDIMGLAFEGEFWEMMNLGKEIQGQIGLPDSNFVALVQEYLLEP